MRLNCALVSSFNLFVSAVLAGYHSEEQQTPGPFLDHVEKSINIIDPDPDPATDWAGVVWVSHDPEKENVDYVTGTFTVPTPNGDVGSGVEIVVGIGGYQERDYAIRSGITVTKTRYGISYRAWGQWGSRTRVHPDRFHFFVGHEIKATILAQGHEAGMIQLVNLSNNDLWSTYVSSGVAPRPYIDAEWVVTTLPRHTLPLPNFNVVVFQKMGVVIAGVSTDIGHLNDEDIFTFGIQEGGRFMTKTYRPDRSHYAIIVYKPQG